MDDNRPSAAGLFISHKKSDYDCCVPQCRSNARYDLHLSFHHMHKVEKNNNGLSKLEEMKAPISR